MAGLLGFLAAGAVKGAGDGIVAEAKAKREAAIADLANQRLESREATDRAFRSQEGKLDRDARLGEAATDREFRAGEGEKDRTSQAEQARLGRQDVMTNDKGEAIVRDGDRVRPVLDGNDKPVKAMAKTDNAPADAQMVDFLVAKGIAKDPAEAYKLVKQSKGETTTQAEIVKMAEEATKTEFNGAIGVTAEKVQEARERNYQRLMEMFGPKEEAEPVAKRERPKNASDEDLIKGAKAAIAGGKDPLAVKSRLRAAGIDPVKAGL